MSVVWLVVLIVVAVVVIAIIAIIAFVSSLDDVGRIREIWGCQASYHSHDGAARGNRQVFAPKSRQ